MDAFDIVIVGGGSAGISAAMRGADQGARVCLIEQERDGGRLLYTSDAADE